MVEQALTAGAQKNGARSGSPVRLTFNFGLIVLAALISMFFGACALTLIGLETGLHAMIVGLLCATVPVPVYVALLLWIDRFEPEPPWMLVTAFLWGALLAFIPAVIVNSTVMAVIGGISESASFGEGMAAMFSAPPVEESCKAAILFIYFFWRKADFDGVVDGIVYAGMVALGFAMIENVLYYGKGMNEGHLVPSLFLRGVLSPYAHPLFTSMTGIGLGIARESSNRIIKWLAPIFGLGVAITLHAIWNGSEVLGAQAGFFLTYILLMVPMFFGVLATVFFALRREGKMVSEKLKPELACGVLSVDDLRGLGSALSRFGATMNALTDRGFSGWRNCCQFQEAASALAFHRRRIERGQIERNELSMAREEELVCWVKACKDKLN